MYTYLAIYRYGSIAIGEAHGKSSINYKITISYIHRLCGYPVVCLEYSGYASHFLFHARLVTCKSAKKWYLMRICISWLCPFKKTCAWTKASREKGHSPSACPRTFLEEGDFHARSRFYSPYSPGRKSGTKRAAKGQGKEYTCTRII